MNYVPVGPTDNELSLIQVMAWRWTGAKPLPESMTTQICQASPHD